jgi:murein DD-endopeptidase MepM/ murein hydrolase activator NlpD
VLKLIAAALLVLPLVSGPVAPPVPAGVEYSAPVGPLDVVRPFDPPAARYGPGHLGVDLAVRPHQDVRAAGAGVVTFAGSVAGRGVVVLLHADGVRTEYEPLRIAVHRGGVVSGGALLGRVSGRHGDCAPNRCLHWGARRRAAYLDPLLLLRRLGTVRLLPWSGPP